MIAGFRGEDTLESKLRNPHARVTPAMGSGYPSTTSTSASASCVGTAETLTGDLCGECARYDAANPAAPAQLGTLGVR